MRSSLVLACAALLVSAAGCPPSAAQIKTARDAHYRGPPESLLQGAEEAATEQHYKIRESNPDAGAFITLDKVWSPEGETESTGAGDAIQVRDKSIIIAFVVRVVAAGHDQFAIQIEPKIRRMYASRPNLDDLEPDDPSLPGWVGGKTDELTVAIHDKLAAFAAPAAPAP